MRQTPFLFRSCAIITAFSLTVASCTKPDGAPRRYVNYRAIPDAIPKNEYLSPKVNPSSYVVRGKRYRILKSYKNYDKIGIASWYGTKFHGKLTSTGERYNMNGMSAANKELPIPCYAEVTNLNNKRTVIVKINDRGPFVDNRLIDLSYAAAQKLGIVGTGTAKVRVRTIDPNHHQTKTKKSTKTTLAQTKTQPVPTGKAQPKQPKLYLQIAAYQDNKSALTLQKRLMEKALFGSEILHDSTHSLYRVKVGPSQTLQRHPKQKTTLSKITFLPR